MGFFRYIMSFFRAPRIVGSLANTKTLGEGRPIQERLYVESKNES